MTKKNNANSARRKLIPAVGMLVVSAMMLSSSTYAWFTMSDNVSVTGMQLKATSDGGLLIINETLADEDVNWKTSTTASHSGLSNDASPVSLTFFPTSTSDASTWYYNISDQFDNAAHYADSPYITVTATDSNNDGAYGLDAASQANAAGVKAPVGNYYLLNKFYIKSSGNALTNGSLNITQVKSAIKSGTTASDKATKLNKSLRIAVVSGSQTTIFAPFASEDVSYSVNGNETATTAKHVGENGAVTVATGVSSIPANTAIRPANGATGDPATEVKVYAYFEGEDTECKSSNTTNGFDELTLDLKFAWVPSGSGSGSGSGS